MDDQWEDNSLAPVDGNNSYADRILDNNARVAKMISDAVAKETQRLKEENSRLEKKNRETESVMEISLEQFNVGKKKVEEEYQEATLNSKRLEFRLKDSTLIMKRKDKEIASLKEALKEKDGVIRALKFNYDHLEVYLEKEFKEDEKMAEEEEENGEQELRTLAHMRQQAEEAEQLAKNRLANNKKQRDTKTQQARKRIELIKRVRNSAKRRNGLSSNGVRNVSPNEEEDGDAHAPLQAFDDGVQAGGNFDLVARSQRRETERSFGIDQQDNLFTSDDHITPSPTKGTRGESDASEVHSEQDEFSNYNEEMSQEPPAAEKVQGKKAGKNAQKEKTVKKPNIVKTKRDRYNDAMKHRKLMQGKPPEKWNCVALKAECLYKKQKGDKAVPEKKAELFEMYKVRSLRASPPCSDAEDFDEENKMEEEMEEDSQVERKDDHHDNDTEVEDESAAEEYKAGKFVYEEESKAEDDAEEHKPEEEEDENEL